MKKVETAFAMGKTITLDDVSVSHRLHMCNQRPTEFRPIRAKFTRWNTRNLIYKSKHRLKIPENRNNIFVRDQLSKERARTLYWMKDEGHKVTTCNCRLLFQQGRENEVINTLSELGIRLGRQATKLKKVFEQ